MTARRRSRAYYRAVLIICVGGMLVAVLIADHLHLTNHR